MIIGLILNSAPGYSETFFRSKIRLLEENGVNVIVFANQSDAEEIEYQLVSGFNWSGNGLTKIGNLLISVFRLILSPLRALKLFQLNKKDGFSLKKNCLSLLTSAHILRHKPDWLHFGFATAALGRENLGRALSARVSASIRGYDMAVYPQKNADCYRLLWERIDKLHHLSDDLYALAIKENLSEKIAHQKITPAIDVSLFKGRVFQGFSEKLKLVTVGRLHWIKGFDYVLESLSLLVKNGVEFEYTVIGDGKDYERLIFACHQLGLENKVRFVGKKTPAEITETLRDSDIYLQYSIHEGFCNALLEAQAIGLLCIGSDGGAIPENIVHNQTGWIVPRRNPQSLAKQILEILSLPEDKLSQLSAAATIRIKSEFNHTKQKKELLNFYLYK